MRKTWNNSQQGLAAGLRRDLLCDGIIANDNRNRGMGHGIATEGDRIDPSERAAIDAFIAAKGVRKIPPADTGQDLFLCTFLRWLGFKVQRYVSDGGERRAPFFIDGRAYDHRGFVSFVNEVRTGFGMVRLGSAA